MNDMVVRFEPRDPALRLRAAEDRVIRERCSNWLRGYVNGWKAWEGLRADFWQQQRAGNDGRAGQWF